MSKRKEAIIQVVSDPYSQFILDQYLERKKKNPKYSIRAYSNFLAVDHSQLAKVLSGKTTFSTKNCLHCLRKLSAAEKLINELIESTRVGTTWKEVSEEDMEIIAKWEYMAILELLSVPGYIGKVKNTANSLGLTLSEAKKMHDLLETLGYIKKQDQVYVRSQTHLTSYPASDSTNEARKINQRRLLKKSLESIDEIPFEQRDHSAVLVALAEEDIPLYKTWIRESRRQLTELFQKNKNFNSVYALQISFFPLNSKVDQNE